MPHFTIRNSLLSREWGIGGILLAVMLASYARVLPATMGTLEFNVSPSMVHGPPGKEFWFVITYSASEETEVYVEYSNTLVEGNGAGSTLFNVHGLGRRITLYGDGSLNFSIKTSPWYFGEYTIEFKLSDGTVVAKWI